jgi:SAM-dependent methyltransferase
VDRTEWVASHLERPLDVFEIAYRLLAPGGHAVLLFLTRPPWYVRRWFAPFVRVFQARWVDLDVLRDLPGLSWGRHFRGGLVTAVHLVREAQ